MNSFLQLLLQKESINWLMLSDPVSHERGCLQRCLRRHPKWLVNVESMALGGYQQDLKIRFADEQSTLRQDRYRNHQFDQELIAMTTLDAFADQHRVESIRLCKSDLGYYGSKALLVQQHLDAFFTDCQNSTFPAIQHNLQIGNYQPFCIQPSDNFYRCSASFYPKAFEGNLIAPSTQKVNS